MRRIAAKSFVDRMDFYSRGDKAGMVSWDDTVDFLQILTDDSDLIKNKIEDVDSSGGTDLNVGLSKAIALLDANARTEPSTEAIIYLTDGNGPYTACDHHDGPAAHAKSKNYTIYAIGLGTGANNNSTTALQDMASCTGGIFYSAPTAANIHAVFDAIFRQITSNSIPHNIDVNAVINHCHAIDWWSITPTPKETHGQTIIWNSIDAGAGLEAGQIVKLSFEARSSCGGNNVMIFEPHSNVTYAPFDDSSPIPSTTPPSGFVVSLPDVSIDVNVAPTAECKESVMKEANNMCQACFHVQDVDNGSFDMYTCPVHEPPTLSISWDPDTCFDLGSHNVSMTARDSWALSSTCYTHVTVVDTIAPLISCNLPDGFIPSHVPLDLVPTALDNCPVTLEITGFECWMVHGGGRIRKNESCIVSIRDDRFTATILDSGGVGTMIHVFVKATDSSGNVQEETCIVNVVHPDHRNGN
jgi:Ca-activated chloride channel family protein